MEIVQLLRSRRCPLANTPQLVILLNYICSQPPLQISTEIIALTVLVITFRRGPHRKHRSSIIACVFVATGTCSPSRCPETVAVYSPYLEVVHASIFKLSISLFYTDEA
jgi:hypothetical protein